MPARFIQDTEQQLREKTTLWLEDNRLTYEKLNTYITPRRFAVQIIGLIDQQADLETEVRGPAKKIAHDEHGEWSKADIGFSKCHGVIVDDIFFNDVNETDNINVIIYTACKLT